MPSRNSDTTDSTSGPSTNPPSSSTGRNSSNAAAAAAALSGPDSGDWTAITDAHVAEVQRNNAGLFLLPDPEDVFEALTLPPVRSSSPAAPPLPEQDAPEESFTIRHLIDKPGNSVTKEDEKAFLRTVNWSELPLELSTQLHDHARRKLERAIDKKAFNATIAVNRLLAFRRLDAAGEVEITRLKAEIKQLEAWEKKLRRMSMRGLDAEEVMDEMKVRVVQGWGVEREIEEAG